MNRARRRAETPRRGAPAQSVQPLFDAALRHHQAGQTEEAERLYRRVLSVRPLHADSLHLLGVVAFQQLRLDQAAELIGRAIAVDSGQAPFHSNLGNVLWKQGKLPAAAASYQRALELRPDYPIARFNLATVLWKQGHLPEAEAGFRATLRSKPNYPEAHDNLGGVLKDLGRLDEAIACYRAAIGQRANYPEAHNNLGTALLEQRRPEDAVVCYRTAIALRPDYPEAHFNLGTACHALGQPDAAVALYQTALALRPDYPDARLNLGTALKELGRLDEAVACYRAVLAAEPDNHDTRSNLGIVLLAQGNLAEGWEAHEWRWLTPQMLAARRDFVQPQWRGEAASGQTLLIHAEQGFGDTIQFCRYASLAAARGLRVILEVQPSLVRLLRDLPGVERVIARGEPLPRSDWHCPMLSLPLALGTTLTNIPAEAAYLRADATQAAHWETRLAEMAPSGPRVGLVWAGSPRDQSAALAAVDRRRSIEAARLAPLFHVTGSRFFTLQKAGPRAPSAFPLIDVMAEMNDFADTAALVANLDLVISVDTAVAHLAAALGKPVWLLDRFDACWRWFTGRRDSPWYPSLRLYRQTRPGDWDAVLNEVVADLTRFEAASVFRPQP